MLKKKDFGTIRASLRIVDMGKKRIFSGIQPSGNLHLGNYLGAIRQWTELQDAYEAVFCIVDLHAITVPQDPAELRRKTLEVAKIYLAAGIDPKQSTLFVQSHVSAHTELAWILNTVARIGDLTKMTQLKDKAGLVDDEVITNSFEEFSKNKSSQEIITALETMTSEKVEAMTKQVAAEILLKFLKGYYIDPLNKSGVGLFDYPVLMAADILLYDTDVVPVGKDQLQHIELARTLARRFNERFGETFVIPEGKLSKEGALIMGLDDPSKKMSKSANSEYNYIALSDTPEQVRRKIMKAVTDSGSEIAYTDEKPALKNLINIYSLLSSETPEAIVSKFAGKGYGDFKRDLAEVIVNFLTPFQERLRGISDEDAVRVLADGAERIRPMATEKLRAVYEKVGLLS